MADVLDYPLKSSGRELPNQVVYSKSLKDQPAPVDIAALMIAKPIPGKAVIPICGKRIVCAGLEEERENDVIDLLGRGLHGIAEFSFPRCNNQANVDRQANAKLNGNSCSVIVLERTRKLAGVREQDVIFVRAVKFNFVCVERETGELLNVHDCFPLPSKFDLR